MILNVDNLSLFEITIQINYCEKRCESQWHPVNMTLNIHDNRCLPVDCLPRNFYLLINTFIDCCRLSLDYVNETNGKISLQLFARSMLS